MVGLTSEWEQRILEAFKVLRKLYASRESKQLCVVTMTMDYYVWLERNQGILIVPVTINRCCSYINDSTQGLVQSICDHAYYFYCISRGSKQDCDMWIG